MNTITVFKSFMPFSLVFLSTGVRAEIDSVVSKESINSHFDLIRQALPLDRIYGHDSKVSHSIPVKSTQFNKLLGIWKPLVIF